MALYRVNEDDSLTGIEPASLSGEGKQERADLQRWLRDHPDALEDGLFVLDEEHGDWADSNRRIDLLALDADGRLVVVELKRDEGPFMDLQALRYASMVAHMTFGRAVEAHKRYLGKRGIDGDARERILEHLGADGGGEPDIQSARPRILLAAATFPRELTTAVLWLNEAGLDIRCVRLVHYRVGGDLVLDATQAIPLPEAADYMVRLRDHEAEQSRAYPRRDWTREEIARLARLVEERATNAITLQMLDAFAAAPEQWVTLADIRAQSSPEQRAGYPGARFATGSMAGLTKLIRREFDRDNWPIDYEYREGGDARAFRMPREIASWWNAARPEAPES